MRTDDQVKSAREMFSGCINPDMARERYVKVLLKSTPGVERASVTDCFLYVLEGMHGQKFHGKSGEGKQYEYTFVLNPKIETGWQEIVVRVAEIVGGSGSLYIKRAWLWVECSEGKSFDDQTRKALLAFGCTFNWKRTNETGIDILIFKADGAPRARSSKASYPDMKRNSFVSAGERERRTA